MDKLEFNLLPTIIGSMPHSDASEACKLIVRFLKGIPAWPQLPRRSPREQMVNQFSAHFPGITEGDRSLFVNKAEGWEHKLTRLYNDYLNNNFKDYTLSPEYAAGFFYSLKQVFSSLRAFKGQVTGPLSWGLTVKDGEGKAIIYDETLSDAVARYLGLCARWQENELNELYKKTIIIIDEPAMSSYGSAYLPLSRDRIINLMEEVFGGIKGIRGVHCCGNTDWSILTDTSAQILSFDTYNYAESLSIYLKEISNFLAKGNAIAWGIVPNSEKSVADETVASLKDRLEESMAPFTRNKGLDFKHLCRQSLLTPSCGLAYTSPDIAEEILNLLTELSKRMRKVYL